MKAAFIIPTGLVLCSGALCVPISHPDDDGASFIGLGDLPGGYTHSQATAVSADGSVVVGWSYADVGGRAFRWENGVMSNLGTLPGASSSGANAVSRDGSIVVGFSDADQGVDAFRWTAADGMTALRGSSDGSFESIANGISADGSVIVGYRSAGATAGDYFPSPFRTDRFDAFRWDSQGGFSGLGDLVSPSTSTLATAVSADGSTVIGSAGSLDGGTSFRWSSGGAFADLGSVFNVQATSQPLAVSADGSVIVGWSRTNNEFAAFRWTLATAMVSLGSLPDGQPNSGTAVSADGNIIVGSTYLTPINGENRSPVAIIWDPVNGTRKLQEVLVNGYGLDLTGWQLGEPTGISADGRTIVGTGVNPDGRTEAWIVHLHESSLTN